MPAAAQADAGMPGPASLVANSLLQPKVSPLQPAPAGGSAGSLPSSRSASVESFDRPNLSRATTTVTTVAEPAQSGPGTVTTETFTHVGTSKVGASFSKKDGSITLRPIAVRGTVPSQIKAKRGFSTRTSKFDRNNSDSAKDTFRGFYVLFWLMLAVSAAKTGVRNWQEDGTVFGVTFARLITEDGWTLAFSDGIMVVSTFLCVPFAQLMSGGWLRYWPMGAVLQHILQTAFLFISVAWTVYKDWPWVQSGFMVLHTLTMLMKVHSFCATNGDLSEKALELKELLPKLQKLVKTLGGVDKVADEALAAWKAAEDTTDGETSELETNSQDFAPSASSTLRKRIVSRSSEATATEEEAQSAVHDQLEALAYHPNAELSALAIRIAELDEALVSTGPAKVRYPSNLTYYNFLDFLAVPTLVYELEYPRTNVIRPLYVAEKTGALFGTFGILILIVEHYIIPVKPQAGDSFLKSALDLALPFMLNYLLIFYLIFECVANVFAELTCFGDRAFYEDWWNSTSFDEFSRKWNVPVHTFLLRHVYSSTISTYRFSKFKAAFATFLLSACVHELVMAVSMKKLRLYLFVMQMAQLPLIMIGRLPIFRKYPALGNLFFWLGLGSGFPLLAIAYIRF